MSGRRIFTRPARLAEIAPYLWMALFFLVPFIFVMKISLSQTAIAQPPYIPVFDLTAGAGAIKAAFAALSLDNFRLLLSDSLYLSSYLRSLVVAAISTSILLLIGYPIAYGMARLTPRWQSVAMMLVIVPFWTSFLIRIYAWINILQHDGHRLAVATRDAGTIFAAQPRQPVTKTNVCVAIRPEKVKLSRRGPAPDAVNTPAINRMEGVVTDVGYLGGFTTYKVKLDSGAVVRSSMANTARLDLDAYSSGQRVVAWFIPDDCVVLER